MPLQRITTLDPNASASDADLVAGALLDRTGFAQLYARYRDDVLRYAFRVTGDWDDAADATQEIFVKAMNGLNSFENRGIGFRGWLFRIAHNQLVDAARRQNGQVRNLDVSSLELVDPQSSQEEVAVVQDDHRWVVHLLSHLSPARRRVCELRLAGLSDREIAAILDMSEGAVRTACSRAAAQLRELRDSAPPVSREHHV